MTRGHCVTSLVGVIRWIARAVTIFALCCALAYFFWLLFISVSSADRWDCCFGLRARWKSSKLSSFSTGVPYTLPCIVGATSLLIISRHSDGVHERCFHVAAAILLGGCCIRLAVAAIPRSLLIACPFIALSGVGAYGPMGAFLAMPTETLPPRIVGSASPLQPTRIQKRNIHPCLSPCTARRRISPERESPTPLGRFGRAR